MHTRKSMNRVFNSRNFWLLLLAFSSFAASLSGFYFANAFSSILPPLMRSAAYTPVSIVCLAFVILPPFFLTAVILYSSKAYLLLPLCFFKTYLYALSVCTVHLAFGASSWLISCLLLFSDSVAVVTLHWFWINHIFGSRRSACFELFICIVVCLMAVIIDYLVVSPFLVKLMTC